ncbi:MAG: PD-(D/E)XK nuclease family protein [Salinibacter sp.]
MMSQNAVTALPAQLASVCEAHPRAPKVVLVPRMQLGRALENGVAHDEGGWAGLVAQIPRHYATTLAQPRIAASGRSELPVGGRVFLVADLLRGLDRDVLPPEGPGGQQLASTIADTIRTLRLNGVHREAVQEWAAHPSSPSTFPAVAACYDAYHAVLEEHGLYDDALVFRWATKAVRRHPPRVANAVVAVCDGVDLPGQPFAFVQALRECCHAFYRLGRPSGVEAPPQTGAGRFAEVEPPSAQRTAASSDTSWQFRRAVGARAEVQAALRDILTSEVPFDDVELAFTEPTPYLSLLADQADRVGVPLTLGPGHPAATTRTGQALQAFFDWIVEDFDAEILIRMLRGGLIRLDRLQAEWEGTPLDAHEVATTLAAHRYEPGREGYGRTLAAVQNEHEERLEEVAEGTPAYDALREERDRVHRVRRIVDTLLSLVPRRASIHEMARATRQFVERMSPVDPPPDALSEDDRTLDQAARTVLWQKLDALTALPFDYEASGTRLASLLRRWLDQQYVQAQSPRPGAVHVLPLESAGYGTRSHLAVLGLDGETFSSAAANPGALRKADRQALREHTEGMVSSNRMRPADEALWRATQALDRHTGPKRLYTRTFDLESGEERYPAPLFLQLEAAHGASSHEPAPAGLVPTPSDVMLQSMDAWLSATRTPAADGETEARERLAREYPWIIQGEAAQAARDGAEYGEHDGLLPNGAYPRLALGHNGPVSASRLETLAETPYVYFLRYVLGVDPLEEPALDDAPWLTPLRRGSILHATFERFLRGRDAPPERDDEEQLVAILDEELEAEIERVAPRSQVEREAARRRLQQDARVFFRVECQRSPAVEPVELELGFGMGPRRRTPQDEGLVHLPLGALTLPLRGRIDRVDREPDGTLTIWDYKTGSASRYDEDDPLQDGAHLQWALYAYALETLREAPVERSGYFFPTAKEMGTRISFRPAAYRDAVERLVERLDDMARSGSFPMTPDAPKTSAWRYQGYDRLVHDLRGRARTLKGKTYPDARPEPPKSS